MIRVMIVEDDPPAAALLRRIIEKKWPQSDLTIHPDPIAALRHWRDVGADIVLLDWGLPGMTGLELLKHIRRSARPVTCVMITGYSDRDKILAARAQQIDGYIVKPFDIQHVVSTLTRLIDAARRMPSPSHEIASASIDEFALDHLKRGPLGLPIDRDIVDAVDQLRDADAETRIGILRRCQRSPALVYRMLSLANSGEYVQGTEVAETFEVALRRIGVGELVNLALELSLYPGSQLRQEVLGAKQAELQREAMSLIGIVSKLREHVEFDLAACRSACLLARVGELALLRIMQVWLDSGRPLDEAACAQVLRRHATRATDQLRAQWMLPITMRERIDALVKLPEGIVRREPLLMRIAWLLSSGDPDHELPRLLSRFGLGGSVMAGSRPPRS